VKVESDYVLVSFDVTSLFRSIPLEKVLISPEKWLEPLSFSKFGISELTNFASFIMPSNLERMFTYKIMV
jgi:hypothetical protein